MTFKFIECEPDDTLEELLHILKSLVDTEVAQYIIETELDLADFPFQDPSRFKEFFNDLSGDANQEWTYRVNREWDFSKVPFRESTATIEGLYKILRTGGAYSENYDRETALAIEERIRNQLQQDSPCLFIFSVVSYTISEDENGQDIKGFIIDLGDLGQVSSFFEELAWDDLIFIINPQYYTLYVVAFTDTD